MIVISKQINIAVDGPAGAGKSTVAREVARRLGYIYIDTGAMYRAVTLKLIRSKVDYNNTEEVMRELGQIDLSIKYSCGGQQQVFLGQENVSNNIRNPEISKLASPVSQKPEIRRMLVKIQQDMAKNGGVVMDGRDIGSNVLPDAQCKIYLTASVEERAKRRYYEMISAGINTDYEQLLQDIITRDKNDFERKLNPLTIVADAHEIDSTFMTLEEVIDKVLSFAEAVIGKVN